VILLVILVTVPALVPAGDPSAASACGPWMALRSAGVVRATGPTFGPGRLAVPAALRDRTTLPGDKLRSGTVADHPHPRRQPTTLAIVWPC
jgi:hypothetical protein